MKALLFEGIHPDAAKHLRSSGFSVESLPGSPSESLLKKKIKGVSLLGVRSRTRVTRELIHQADSLMAVGSFCVGTDNVDLEAANEYGIAVFNAPYSNTRSVAELVIGEIIMLSRGIFPKSLSLHEGIWDKSAAGSHEVRGTRIGIIGYGNIGGQVGILAEALGMEVFYYDIQEKLNLGNAKRCRSLRELLKKADAVTIHVDDQPENVGLIGEKQLRAMKPGALFVNASRGRVVDLKALARAVKSGRLRGAAIDVYPKEPADGKDAFKSELQGVGNVILTPHIGGSTLEAQMNIGAYVAGRLTEYLSSGDTFYNASLPQVKLPVRKKSHRLLHIHENVTGVMSQITTLLAGHGINIIGQSLKTNDNIGYLITDIGKKYDESVLEALRTIRETIRFRVLY